MEKECRESTRERLLTWMDQFENDHYVFDVYGETVTVDLQRETVTEVLDDSFLGQRRFGFNLPRFSDIYTFFRCMTSFFRKSLYFASVRRG